VPRAADPHDGAGSTVTALADELLDVIFDDDPIADTLVGDRTRDHLLADRSRAAESAFAQRYADLARRAADLDVGAAPSVDQVTRDVVRSFAAASHDRKETGVLDVTVTDLFVAPPAELLSLMPFVSLTTPEQADAYLTRLEAVPRFLETIGERQAAASAEGRTAVAHLARRAAEHIDRYLADSDHDPLMAPAAPEGWSGAAAFDERRRALVRDVVRPAYARYAEVVRAAVVPRGRDEEHCGLCNLPDGDGMYAALMRFHTTTDRSAEDLHQTGLDIAARLDEEYAEVGGRALGETNAADVFRRLRDDPSLRYDSAEEILEAARTATRRAEAEAPAWFGRLPSHSCVVMPVPEHEAPQTPGAMYLQGAPDGSRKGTFLVNTYRPTDRARHDAEAATYHEAVPGHHFQLTIQQELAELPKLRRLIDITAYGEGWGLYSERLADEMGLYSDDLARIGMLTLDSMRAARLVVDTGLHALGWSRQQAIDYMVERTPMMRHDIEVEVDRYISDPGQALAYMVGRLEILRLRELARQRLGDDFRIRDFHDVVLGVGAVPMAVLETVVARWADEGPQRRS
jgi:uncharacterized protein (DUF885 family)